MLSRLIVTNGAHDETPYNPVVGILPILLNCFLDFLNGLALFSFLVKSKCPMPMRAMGFRVVKLGCTANVDCLLVELMHIVEKSEVVIGKSVLWVIFDTVLKVLYSFIILLQFEVSQT